MNELTLEWLHKAEGDFATVGREVRARRRPNYDAACFHAQQAAEKYLKAILQECGAEVPRTHNLIELLERCLTFDASLEHTRDLLLVLDRYSVRYRYPGESAEKNEAQRAYRIVKEFRKVACSRLRFWPDSRPPRTA
jgi:HEPN domain-containing protein